jgi:hypothetical protein
MHTVSYPENSERDYLGELKVDEKIVLKVTLRKKGVRM